MLPAAPALKWTAEARGAIGYRQITGTAALTLEDLERIAEEEATPFGAPKNTALTLSDLLADCEPDGLGAAFLRARADEGALG